MNSVRGEWTRNRMRSCKSARYVSWELETGLVAEMPEGGEYRFVLLIAFVCYACT